MDKQPYQRPQLVDTTRYQQSEQILEAFSTTDEYFVEDKPVDPLVLIVDALLSTLPPDEKEVVEMVIIGRLSQHETARLLGYINKNGKEDHKMVTRRLKWALTKLRETLTTPSFALAIAGHKMPVDEPDIKIKQSLTNIINQLEKELENDDE